MRGNRDETRKRVEQKMRFDAFQTERENDARRKRQLQFQEDLRTGKAFPPRRKKPDDDKPLMYWLDKN